MPQLDKLILKSPTQTAAAVYSASFASETKSFNDQRSPELFSPLQQLRVSPTKQTQPLLTPI